MDSNFIPRTNQASLGRRSIDAGAAKLSLSLELKKTMNWGSITHLLWEISQFRISLVVRSRIAHPCRSKCFWWDNGASYPIGGLSCRCGTYSVVERTYGSLRRWPGSGGTQLEGLLKAHSEHVT